LNVGLIGCGAVGQKRADNLAGARLIHCVDTDLASAAHRHLSISEICFRWGFNDAAHFSRSFGAEYGMTPREFRQKQLGALRRAH